MVDYSIVLIGFMGTGKSSVASVLSEKIKFKLIDTDQLIEETMEMTISKIFETYGEIGFRKIEENTIKEISTEKASVISCGGGVCLREENIRNIKRGNKVILLEASPSVVLDRIEKDINRPILKEKMDIENIEKIMKKRKGSYDKAADIIIDTDNKTILEIVDEIIERCF